MLNKIHIALLSVFINIAVDSGIFEEELVEFLAMDDPPLSEPECKYIQEEFVKKGRNDLSKIMKTHINYNFT